MILLKLIYNSLLNYFKNDNFCICIYRRLIRHQFTEVTEECLILFIRINSNSLSNYMIVVQPRINERASGDGWCTAQDHVQFQTNREEYEECHLLGGYALYFFAACVGCYLRLTLFLVH
jgi:hypothetical protein